MQQVSGSSQVADVNQHDEVGGLIGVFFLQILSKKPLKALRREAKDIEILAVGFDPRRWNFFERFEYAPVDDGEPCRESAPGGNYQHALCRPGFGGMGRADRR